VLSLLLGHLRASGPAEDVAAGRSLVDGGSEPAS
jgi:hypothetical protein